MSRLPETQDTLASALGELLKRDHPAPYSTIETVIRSVPQQRIELPLARDLGVTVEVRRDDLIDPLISGNKLYKLMGHLRAYASGGARGPLVSFGGAYSNHLHALAALGHRLNLPTVGFVRGEAGRRPSPTCADMERWGMRLHYLSRGDYRQKACPEFVASLQRHYGIAANAYWIPEGGGGEPGMVGPEILGRVLAQSPSRVIALACGTATTMAGIGRGLLASRECGSFSLLGIAALRSHHSLLRSLSANVPGAMEKKLNWTLSNQYHFGGFARISDELVAFMQKFQGEYSVPLDKIYTAKLFYAVVKMLESNVFSPGTNILLIHTGGLQGNRNENVC